MFVASMEWRMLEGRLPIALTSAGAPTEPAPLSAVEPMVDILCCERCLLMLPQPEDVVSAPED